MDDSRRPRISPAAVVLLGGVAAASSAAAVVALARGGPVAGALGVVVGAPLLLAIAVAGVAASGRRAASAIQSERARALDALAASERRRTDAAPLAEAGARAAAAAHDMAGPIAALSANLDWLDEELAEGRLAVRDGEVRAVVADARASAEALVRALSTFRRASDAAKRALREADRAGALPDGPSADGGSSGE